MTEYAGNRWYKCDLHLHTMSSRCYLEQDNTAEEWVRQALSQGLNVVAVTDHNDYRGISAVMEEGQKQGLAVFPGVEITCDSSKIHMLILFDTSKHAETVRDFLNRCDIDSERIGDPDGTSLGVFEVCEIAKKRGAMVIAAHIDEFNSISSMNPANLDRLFEGGYIDAVQVANLPVWRKLKNDRDTESMQAVLQEKYGADATPQEVDRWRKCFNRAEEAGIPMLAFSDNPHAPNVSKHGLWGIGSVYTWIQMDDVVNLESIRQSLVAPESRIRMMYDSESEPKTEPDFWIRSLEVRRTKLNPHAPLHLDFHPQLNCIIGGKGSGKSAIVHILLGVYRQFSGSLLKNTQAQQESFYKKQPDEEGRGIFHEDSEIEIRYSWYGGQYRLLVTEIRSMDDQKFSFFRLDPETSEEVPEDCEKLLQSAFFCAQVFIQRQINEITMTPGALLDYVDRAIDDMHLWKARKAYYLEELVNLSAQIHTATKYLSGRERVRSELLWFERIEKEGTLSGMPAERAAAMVEARQAAINRIEGCCDNTEALQNRREELFSRYENCIDEMRKLRKEFIDRVLAEDENYRMELEPMASRDSFYRMLGEMLPGDEALLSDDTKKLEAALFGEKNGLSRYIALLGSAREGSALPESAGTGPAETGFSAYFLHLIRKMRDADFERMLLFRPEDELNMFYHPNGVKRFFPMTNASAGEKATAVFSFMLASSSTPLVIDQPEDDMDNRVIYEEVVRKLKKAKSNRQMIIVTHNANIATTTDPEMILSMDSRSKFKRVKLQGSADNDEVRRELCDVVEGTESAFMQRARKYHLRQE